MNNISLLRNLCKSTESNGENHRVYQRFRQCSVYSNIHKVQELIGNGLPISFLQESQITQDVVYVVISGNNCIHLHEIICDDEGGQCLYNLWYTKVSMYVESTISFENLQSIDFNTFTSCLAVSHSFDLLYYYYLYSNDWLYRGFDGKFKLPCIPKSMNMFVNKNM